jgi:hypothetical protein
LQINSPKTDPLKLNTFRAFGCALIIAFCFGVSTGSRLDDYHGRIKQAVTALDTLAQNDENETSFDYSNRANNTIVRVKSTIPETEQIEWDGITTTADNRWLHRELEKFGSSTADEDRKLVNAISQRLQSIDERITEIKNANTTGASKEQSRQRLAEILKRQEYAKNASQPSAFRKLLRDLLKWLEGLFPKQQPLTPGGANFFTQIAQIVVLILALVVLAYVIITFAPRVLNRRRAKRKTKREPRIVLGETLEPDKSANDLLAEAESLARQGDIRAAIRKAYIALLVEMGDRKLISLAQYKTNRDYLRAVRGLEPLYDNLKGLTDSFERHWYGFVRANEDDWTAFRSNYRKALHS